MRERFFAELTAGGLERQLPELLEKLERAGTLRLTPNGHGIYAASASQEANSATGYQNAWLRDNAMVAFSVWQNGDAESALRTARGLGKFLATQTKRFEAILQNPARKENAQQRPHIRFDAQKLRENEQRWPHAQNDALGLTVWLRFRLANEEGYNLTSEEKELYAYFPRYFRAIEYWKDRDSGAWEEGRKVNSSSVGAVMAGLFAMRDFLMSGRQIGGVTEKMLEELIEKGERTLANQLPLEAPPEREADGALLFLLYPLELVRRPDLRHLVLSLVRARLIGEIGIRRYVGDSYFCQDYDEWFSPALRSSDFSDRVGVRDAFLRPGCEAQWALFDPLLSVIYGQQYLKEPGKRDLLELQLLFINRAISQINSNGQCPELFYLKNGSYTWNEHTPLAWTQANLRLAISYLEKSMKVQGGRQAQRGRVEKE